MPRKQQQCSICNSEDHNARGCPKKTGGAEHKVAKFRPPGAASISKNIVGAEALEQIAAEMEADAAALRRVAARLRAK